MARKKKPEESLDEPVSTSMTPPAITADQKARNTLEEARLEIEAVVKKHGIEIGLWFTKADVDRLNSMFNQLPGIVEYKFDTQLRKN